MGSLTETHLDTDGDLVGTLVCWDDFSGPVEVTHSQWNGFSGWLSTMCGWVV